LITAARVKPLNDFRLIRPIDEAKEVSDVVDRFHELSFQFPGVGAYSQIATALAVRELVFVLVLVYGVHFSALVLVYTRPGPKKFLGVKLTKGRPQRADTVSS
jgi:hypothetical protein